MKSRPPAEPLNEASSSYARTGHMPNYHFIYVDTMFRMKWIDVPRIVNLKRFD